jgi:hypothetical protein
MSETALPPSETAQIPRRRPPTANRSRDLLWGRLLGVSALLVLVVLVLSFGIPLAYGLGESGAYAVRSWTRACAANTAWNKEPIN